MIQSAKRLLIPVVCLAVLLGGGATASGEHWAFQGARVSASYEGMAAAGRPVPPVSRGMVMRYAEVLSMTPEQRRLALDLHASMEIEFRELWIEYAEDLADRNGRFYIVQTMGPEERQAQQRTIDRYSEAYSELRSRFLDDLQLLLESDQQDLWRNIDAERRRVHELSMIRDDHSQRLIDIPLALQAIAPDAIDDSTRSRIDAIVEEYLLDIDSAMEPARRRLPRIRSTINEYETHRRADIDLRSTPEGPDRDAAQQAARDAMERLSKTLFDEALALDRIYASVWRVHDQAAERIIEALPDDEGRRFIEALRPWLSVRTGEELDVTDAEHRRQRFLNAIRVLENIGSFQGLVGTPLLDAVMNTPEYRVDTTRLINSEPLSDEQRERIDALVRSYESELAVWNAAVNEGRDAPGVDPTTTRLIRFDGGSITLRRVAAPGQRLNWRRAPGTPEQLLERAELEQRYMDRLRELLTYNQRVLIVNR